MNLKQLEAFVQVAEGGSFFKGSKTAVSDTANHQCTHFVTGERTECKAFRKKYKRSKIIG